MQWQWQWRARSAGAVFGGPALAGRPAEIPPSDTLGKSTEHENKDRPNIVRVCLCVRVRVRESNMEL